MSGVVLHMIKNWTGHHIFGNYTNPMGHSHVDLPFSADMAYMEEACTDTTNFIAVWGEIQMFYKWDRITS